MVDASSVGLCAFRGIVGWTHLLLVSSDGELATEVSNSPFLGMADVSESDSLFPRTGFRGLYSAKYFESD